VLLAISQNGMSDCWSQITVESQKVVSCSGVEHALPSVIVRARELNSVVVFIGEFSCSAESEFGWGIANLWLELRDFQKKCFLFIGVALFRQKGAVRVGAAVSILSRSLAPAPQVALAAPEQDEGEYDG